MLNRLQHPDISRHNTYAPNIGSAKAPKHDMSHWLLGSLDLSGSCADDFGGQGSRVSMSTSNDTGGKLHIPSMLSCYEFIENAPDVISDRILTYLDIS